MRALRIACTAVFALAPLLPLAFAQAQQTSKSKKADDAFFTGPPFSLDDLMQRVGIIADGRLRAAVLRRGVTFFPTPEDNDQLKKAGASAELLQVIAVKAPPPPAPKIVAPPAPALAGPLTLQCAPAECEILIDGKSRGTTTKGSLKISGLPVGEAVVDFRKNGFEGQQISLSLSTGPGETRSVALKPTVAAQAQLGKQLLAKAIEKLGGAPAFQKASLVSGSGNASLWQSGGQRTEWRMTSRLKLPSMALIEVNGAGLKWWTSLAANNSKADGDKKMRGGPIAVEMEKLVRLYRDYQPAMLASRLGKMKLLAPEGAPDSSGSWRLQGTDSDGTLNVTLKADFTPVRVVYSSPSGLGSGLEILYSDYALVEKVYYPKSMTIKFADQPQHGLEIHLDSVRFETKLADKEFHR